MFQNTGEFVYKLEVWEEEDEKHSDAGYFPKYELARHYANNCNKEFIINKIKMVNEEAQWDEEDWHDSPVAYDIYNEKGELIHCVELETCCTEAFR